MKHTIFVGFSARILVLRLKNQHRTH